MSSEDIAISVRGLSKAYTIAHASSKHTTAAEALMHRLRNPFLRPETETFWALKDVSFDIPCGQIVGIIGRNGAGKSTLLKILSRITEPTSGYVHLRGRVGSLLEVGTGFHPELTGRENIYLNGSLLGMNRQEISRQFDAIVDFAEVEQFLDTPVKRYSSGMYVRLAFAVAAHLNPEILIVDEVLAVGDATFQQKCLGKMGDVAQQGRTILFVSHNVAAIRSLCNRALSMANGKLILDSDVETGISHYLSDDHASDAMVVWPEEDAPQSPEVRFKKAYLLNDIGQYASLLDIRNGFSISLEYELLKPVKGLRLGFFMQNASGVPICGSNTFVAEPNVVTEPGYYKTQCTFMSHCLNTDRYSVYFGADLPPNPVPLVTTPYCLSFMVEDVVGHGVLNEKLPGVMRPNVEWETHFSVAKL